MLCCVFWLVLPKCLGGKCLGGKFLRCVNASTPASTWMVRYAIFSNYPTFASWPPMWMWGSASIPTLGDIPDAVALVKVSLRAPSIPFVDRTNYNIDYII